jgi:hypothetical protein
MKVQQQRASNFRCKVLSPASEEQYFELNSFLLKEKSWILLIICSKDVDPDKEFFSKASEVLKGSNCNLLVCIPASLEAYAQSLTNFTVILDPEHTVETLFDEKGNYKFKSFLISPDRHVQYTSFIDDLDNLEFFNEVLRHKDSLTTTWTGVVTGFPSFYSESLKNYPLLTKSVTSCVISMIGELIGSALYNSKASKSNNRSIARSTWEMARRVVIFGAFGATFAGPFFHWWYKYLHQLVHSWNLPYSLSIIMKLLLNQLVMTPPYLLFTIAYIQYFLTFDRKKTLQVLKNSFFSALLMNWKVLLTF